MNTRALVKSLRGVMKLAKANAPLISLVVSGVSFASAVGCSIPATVKAVRTVDTETEKKGAQLTGGEILGCTWKYYGKTAALLALGVVNLVAGAHGYSKALRSLSTLCASYELERRQFMEAAKEKLGEKKFKELTDDIAEKQLHEDPVENKPVYATPFGNALCYDTLSGRYLRCDSERIRRGVNEFNKILLNEGIGSYNDLWDCIDLKIENIPFGEDVGWSIKDGLVELKYASKLATNGEPCLVIQYPDPPYRGYDRVY